MVVQVEICTPSRASALAAKQGGAQRIELCRDLACGGLTPSDEDIEYCTRTLGLRTHVLVRPRAGNFYYNSDEVAEIMATIERCRRLGLQPLWWGFLDYDGRIDKVLTRRAVQAAEGMEVTFHRAFDEARQDPEEALRAIVEAGCSRLLTSGQQPTAPEGAEVIRRLVEAASRLTTAKHRFKVLAGSGITATNARRLVELTGVDEVHGSCKSVLPDGTIETDANQVAQLIRALGKNQHIR